MNKEINNKLQCGLALTVKETRDLYQYIKAIEQTEWIPVEKGLPEVDVDVLVTDDAGGLATVHIDTYGKREESGEGFWYISQNVTAWKYFPQPYKAESEVLE